MNAICITEQTFYVQDLSSLQPNGLQVKPSAFLSGFLVGVEEEPSRGSRDKNIAIEVIWRVLYNTNHPLHEGSNVDLIFPENTVFQPNGIENQVFVGLQIVILHILVPQKVQKTLSERWFTLCINLETNNLNQNRESVYLGLYIGYESLSVQYHLITAGGAYPGLHIP